MFCQIEHFSHIELSNSYNYINIIKIMGILIKPDESHYVDTRFDRHVIIKKSEARYIVHIRNQYNCKNEFVPEDKSVFAKIAQFTTDENMGETEYYDVPIKYLEPVVTLWDGQ